MNCFNCGEEIREPAGYICQSCLDEEMAEKKELRQEARAAIDHVNKTRVELLPREANIAMLDGETLMTAKRNDVAWSEEEGMFIFTQSNNYLSCFRNLLRKSKPRPMDTFECLAWVNSPESQGWMVSTKYVGDNGIWSDWDIPQRFKYDSQERYSDPGVVSYRRARILPDKSGIDESTIKGFLIEVEA